MLTLVHMILGTKGGVGKTTLACHLTDYLKTHQVPFALYDGDEENHSLSRFFSEANAINLRNVRSIDTAVSEAESGRHKVVLVDLRAGSGSEVLEWFEDVPFDELRVEGIGFVGWGCVTTDPDSVTTLLHWADVLKERISYVVVRNEKDGPLGEQLDGSMGAIEFLKRNRPPVLTIPRFHPELMAELNRLNFSMGKVLSLEQKVPGLNDTMMRRRLLRYQGKIFEQFDKIRELIIPA
ncbi:nucleotide-binding protein [Candidatus Methylacidithermus pantelleriae]|uniref:CobQ/CobB/MinD/ParA nucleotide binding domain-containing protein n=1 Tax=Candidatus Methylacidithermus pantelleriae TaxID=2744239 RepID=A0A8J2BIL6_9BACT|nr:hypothetical protein [Candidatus Methylacidithermus pantelleriae]CAF0698011.1 conserved hypothetical protein [Candidatus Methylacidithermus pantelleriae]